MSMETQKESMHAILLACSSLKDFVEQAQINMETDYPVWYLNKSYHKDPALMRRQILTALAEIPEEYNTILVAMGYCGGSWEDIPTERTIVLPRVDDCVSLLMTVDDIYMPNRKEEGCLYVKEKDPAVCSFQRIFLRYTQNMEPEAVEKVYTAWKNSYSGIQVIDTGIYDCHAADYMRSVDEDARWLDAESGYVQGGILLLEKLVSMRWDEQFAVIRPGKRISAEQFF